MRADVAPTHEHRGPVRRAIARLRALRARRPWFYMVTRAGRDLCLLAVGLLGIFVAPPPSVEAWSGAYLLSAAWAGMFVIGTLASLYGIVRDHGGPELFGCSFVGFAFAVWIVAALSQADVTVASVQVALVFGSGVFGQGYRCWMILQQRVVRP